MHDTLCVRLSLSCIRLNALLLATNILLNSCHGIYAQVLTVSQKSAALNFSKSVKYTNKICDDDNGADQC